MESRRRERGDEPSYQILSWSAVTTSCTSSAVSTAAHARRIPELREVEQVTTAIPVHPSPKGPKKT